MRVLLCLFLFVYLNESSSVPVIDLVHDVNTFQWYFDVKVGSPPQSFHAFLDLASPDLIIPLIACSGCQSDTAVYNLNISSSAVELACDSSCDTCYMDVCAGEFRDVAGVFAQYILVQELVSFGGVVADTIVNAAYVVTPASIAPHTFSFGGLALSNGSWFMSVLNEANVNAFSLSMSPSGGAITLGPPSPGLAQSLSWVPLSIDGDRMAIALIALLVGGVPLTLPRSAFGTTFLDSASRFPSVPKSVFDAIASKFRASCSSSAPLPGICSVPAGKKSLLEGACWTLNSNDISLFPKITFALNSTSLGYKAVAYLLPLDCPTAGTLRFSLTYSEENVTRIGASLLQEYAMVFNITPPFAVGFSYKHLPDGDPPLDTGQIIGIVVGGVVGAGILVVIAYLIFRRRGNKDVLEYYQYTSTHQVVDRRSVSSTTLSRSGGAEDVSGMPLRNGVQ